MFSHEGPARSPEKNFALAWYLAGVAGFVNSGGFVLIGTYTSHVTGNVGRFSIDLATGGPGAAVFAAILVGCFFLGALLTSIWLELSAPEQRARAYATALLVESGLLAVFILVAGLSHAVHPRALDAEAAIVCLAMGLQNSLVTRLSSAVVRTTHLTGIFTDLAIEVARWYRWRFDWLRGRHTEPPPATRRRLYLTIIISFATGSAIGGVFTARASRWAMLIPAFAIFGASMYAFREQREQGEERSDPSESG